MNILFDYPQSSRAGWLKNPLLSHFYRPWLVNQGSLTQRLQQRYSDFLVSPVSLRVAKPSQEEAQLLGCAMHQQALIREVILMGNGQPVVFAHSVLPQKSLSGAWQKLSGLGNQPLGATLFANPKVKRTVLSYKKLAAHHPIYGQISRYITNPPPALWSRRSVFQLKHARILVMEVFLPAVLLT